MPVMCPTCAAALPQRPHPVDVCPACHQVIDATTADRYSILLHLALAASGGVIIWILAASGFIHGAAATLTVAAGMIAVFIAISRLITSRCARAFPPVAVRDEAHRRRLLATLHGARLPAAIAAVVRGRLETSGQSDAVSTTTTSSIRG